MIWYDIIVDILAGPEADPIAFTGITQGQIVPARGQAIFGWGNYSPLLSSYGHGILHIAQDKTVEKPSVKAQSALIQVYNATCISNTCTCSQSWHNRYNCLSWNVKSNGRESILYFSLLRCRYCTHLTSSEQLCVCSSFDCLIISEYDHILRMASISRRK